MQSKTTEKVVGLLGGMGPEATIDIFQKIVEATKAKEDEDHLRIIIDNNPKLPSRQDAILKGTESPGAMMALTAKKLEDAGADFIIICANTAHYFYDDVNDSVNIKVLHIIKETVDEIIRGNKHVKKVGVLATAGAMKANIFQTIFSAKEIDVINLPPNLQKQLQESIFSFKSSGSKGTNAEKILEVAKFFVNEGAEAIIMGCTEIPIILEGEKLTIPLLDPNEIIAKAAVKYAKGV